MWKCMATEPLQDYCKAPDAALKLLTINWCALVIKSLFSSVFQATKTDYFPLGCLAEIHAEFAKNAHEVIASAMARARWRTFRRPQEAVGLHLSWDLFQAAPMLFLSDYFLLALRVGWWQRLRFKPAITRLVPKESNPTQFPALGEKRHFLGVHSSLAQFLLQLAQLHSSQSSHNFLSPGKHSKAILQKRT